MSKFIIQGGQTLKGNIRVSGAKNAVLPILAASLLSPGKIRLNNVPRIQDVESMLSIMRLMGVSHTWEGEHELLIDCQNIAYADLLADEVKKMRGSILFLGPVLALFGKAKLYRPGGDIIGARPISVHTDGLRNLGVEVQENEIVHAHVKKTKNNSIVLQEASVTGTETLMMFCAGVFHTTTLKLVATEPHVQALGFFLQELGVKIEGIGTPFLKITGKKNLKKNISFSIPPDPLEAATFVALAAATRSTIAISGTCPNDMDAIFLVIQDMHIKYTAVKDIITVHPSELKGAKIQTGLYPKFPSDTQSPFGVLATQAQGVTLIHDWMYENRFNYLRELAYMGANVEILDPHRALIIGPTPLQGKEVRSLDIRSGISLIIAGLIAKGTTIIYDVEHIDRGYEHIQERLRALGAHITREN